MTAAVATQARQHDRHDDDLRWEAGLATACAVLLVSGAGLHRLPGWSALAHGLQIGALVCGAVAPLRATVPTLLRGRVEVEFLMLVGAFGAAALHDFAEGAVLMFLFSAAGALQTWTSRRTSRSIAALQQQVATTAVRLSDAGEEEVPVALLAVGDHVLVRPGARIPADGRVLSGRSEVDQAVLTGESRPVVKEPGDEVLAASLNLTSGALTIAVSRPSADSTVARMIRLVHEAQQNRARTQVFTDWFGERYTVGVLLAASAALCWFRFGWGHEWHGAIYHAMALLVVASPCALVLATPAAILAAIANAARYGILVKGGAIFEETARLRAVVFDKTGTLTTGRPHLAEVIRLNCRSADEVLALAAAVERESEHPVAQAVVAAAQARGLPLPVAAGFEAFTGRGVRADVAGTAVWVGSRRWFTERGYEVPGCPHGACPAASDTAGCGALVVGTPQPVGLLDVTDTLRPDAPASLAALRSRRLHLTMLTGDAAAAAQSIAAEAGLDDYHADLLPADKLARLATLQQRGGVMMVGDGVNDAPALAAAQVGVAMGGIGSDVAMETADVVLTQDDLTRLPYLVDLSRRTVRVVHQNLAVALTVIAVLATGVLLTDGIRMPLAVVAHEGSTVLVILNGLRLLRGGPAA
ncbi:MAG: cation-translocating P-type ATPase [Fimbriimonadaceae bacterium]|nr:cation-translocating P-type ATPase [Fimbriimonadaceae bacterium]